MARTHHSNRLTPRRSRSYGRPVPTKPTPDVLEAFGATGRPQLLDGGQGQTWKADGIVLKPVGFEPESRWRAGVLYALPATDAFRVARPLRAATGDWVHLGWEASLHVAGRSDPKRWNEAIEAGEAFHAAVAHIEHPEFLEDRDDRWSRADRASWDDHAPAGEPLVQTLMDARRPVTAPEQLVHGDLLGNVLYSPGLPPAIIDWPPYWRPRAWAAAVAAADALCWHRAEASLADRWAHLSDWPQMLLRALLFRILTDREAARSEGRPWQPHPAYRPVADLVLNRAGLDTGR